MYDKEVTSELSSSVREGAGYDKVYSSRRKPKEDFLRSLEREPSTHSPNDEEEDKDEDDEENDEGDEHEQGEEEDEDDQFERGEVVDQVDGGT